jgi:hypothetical protein
MFGRFPQARYARLTGAATHPAGARPSKCIIIIRIVIQHRTLPSLKAHDILVNYHNLPGNVRVIYMCHCPDSCVSSRSTGAREFIQSLQDLGAQGFWHRGNGRLARGGAVGPLTSPCRSLVSSAGFPDRAWAGMIKVVFITRETPNCDSTLLPELSPLEDDARLHGC